MDTTRPTLLQRVKDPRDEEGWREFFSIYQPLLYRYARRRGLDRHLAEDVTQQCMATLTVKMPLFDYAREKGGFKHWLKRMANNKINDLFRKKHPVPALTGDFQRPQERELSPNEIWEEQWKKRHLKYCIKQIRSEVAEHTYQAFEYHVLNGWPAEKVARTLQLSVDQIYTAKSRVTRRLRVKMKELLGE